MEIMKRWFVNIFAAISLLLFAATMAMLVRSYWSGFKGDQIYHSRGLYVDSSRGAIVFRWLVRPMLADREPLDYFPIEEIGSVFYSKTQLWSVLGVESGGYDDNLIGTVGFDARYLVFPCWILCLLELLLPAAWLVHRRYPRVADIGHAFPVELAKPNGEHGGKAG
jgi:hypothetical protein